MTNLKDQLKEKINWNQVDLVMVGSFSFLIKREFCLRAKNNQGPLYDIKMCRGMVFN
jgi:hypothetical protein